MTKAFKCERCGEFKEGTGYQIRIGTYVGTSSFVNDYKFHREDEVCSNCKKSIFNKVDKLMGDFNNE